MPTAIERIAPIPPDEFKTRYVDTHRPVVIEQLLDGPAASWTPDLLQKHADGRPVDVNVSLSGTFYLESEEFRQMPLSAYIEATLQPNADGPKLYLQQQDLRALFPTLADQLPLPAYVDPNRLQSVNLWFGPGGNVSPLHFDGFDNLFLQVSGRKRFILFPPDDFARLYPFDVDTRCSHVSHVRLNGDLEREFPRALQAKRFELLLGPRDALYLPAFYWHHVESVDTSISVNIWSHCRWRDAMVPAVFRTLAHMEQPDGFIHLVLGTADDDTLFEGARTALAEGFAAIGLMLCAAIARRAEWARAWVEEYGTTVDAARRSMLEDESYAGSADLSRVTTALSALEKLRPASKA